MSLTTWDPFFSDPYHEMRRMQRDMDNMFGLSRVEPSESSKLMKHWRPTMDIIERDRDNLVHCELPGVKKEDINIDLNNGLLTISGSRREDKKQESDRYFSRERFYGNFSRTIAIPESVTEDKIKAKFEDGVLELTFPKAETKKKQKKITIS